MMVNESFLKFHLEDNGLVHCANADEYMELFEVLRPLGFPIGFTPSRDDRWEYVGFNNSHTAIHACTDKSSMYEGRIVVKFSDFVDTYFTEIEPQDIDILFS